MCTITDGKKFKRSVIFPIKNYVLLFGLSLAFTMSM